MPFQKIYEIDFRIGPHPNPIFNPFNWPSLQITPNVGETEHQWCPAGLDLKIKRIPSATPPPPQDPEVRNSVYVVPPGGISINSRLHMKLTFLHPNANDGGVSTFVPEPWAIGLRFSSDTLILNKDKSAIATCQFQRLVAPTNGPIITVRLNTPEGFQKDQAIPLEYPINYSVYNPVPPSSVINPDIVPVFTLEHSFSGFNLSNTQHSTGAGFLKISRVNNPDVTDHRVYSRADFTNSNATPAIRALGVNLATNNGLGNMSVRLLTFEVWRDIGSTPL